MAIARVQAAFGGTESSTVGTLTATFGSSVTAGNTVVVLARIAGVGSTAHVSSVADSLSTSYTLRASDASQDPYMYVYTGVAGSGGANTVTVTLDASAWFAWVYAIEYSGVGSYDTAGVRASASAATDLQSASVTTAGAGVVVMAGSQNNFATYSAGTDFTLVANVKPTGSNQFGGVEEYLTSGALSGYTAHLTSDLNAQWTTVFVALSASGGGGGGSLPFFLQGDIRHGYVQQRSGGFQ